MIPLKTLKEIEIMDDANRIVHNVLNRVEENIKEGITTKELDIIAEQEVYSLGAKPAVKNYKGFPASLCISINEEIAHGIPGDRIIQDGDIVSIDFATIYKEFIGDAARTIIVGKVSKKIEELVKNTEKALYNGISKMIVGNRLHDISRAIWEYSKKNKYGNILNLCGHGVGKDMHESPSVFNYVNEFEPNVRLQNGMVLALEPMFTLGSCMAVLKEDGWTAVSSDKSMAAHWELSVAIVDDKPLILGLNK